MAITEPIVISGVPGLVLKDKYLETVGAQFMIRLTNCPGARVINCGGKNTAADGNQWAQYLLLADDCPGLRVEGEYTEWLAGNFLRRCHKSEVSGCRWNNAPINVGPDKDPGLQDLNGYGTNWLDCLDCQHVENYSEGTRHQSTTNQGTKRLHVQRCTAKFPGGQGFDTHGGDPGNLCEDCIIEDCVVEGVNLEAMASDGSAYLLRGRGHQIKNCKVTGPCNRGLTIAAESDLIPDGVGRHVIDGLDMTTVNKTPPINVVSSADIDNVFRNVTLDGKPIFYPFN